MTSVPPPSGNGAREGIADAVLRVLAARGTDALSVRNVAAEAGVSVGAVQHHFPTRAKLIVGAMDAVNDRFRVRLGAALTGVVSPQTRLEIFCHELAALGPNGRDDAVVWTAFASRAATDPEVGSIHEREWARIEDAVFTLLTDAYPRADIEQDDAAVVLAVLDGIAVARGSEGDGRMPPERGRRLIAAVLGRFDGHS
ncbi:TetR/AcrR family transcriptional regulator [Microbacterium sp. che218]|uniref:TetR/AcrR family transcriptional regulator n=1 Tax=Microbacterium sp. che218 TaxID=3140649 RepID=UPI00336C2B88